MNTDYKLSLMAAVKKALLLQDCDSVWFDDVNETTLRFHSVMRMEPVLEVTDDRGELTCPLAYYETEEQRIGLLELFEASRQVWHNEAGRRPSLGASNEPNSRFEDLPAGIIFKEYSEQRLISAYMSFTPDYVIERPHKFASAIFMINRYPDEIRSRICETIYTRMTKTVTFGQETRSYFFCMMMLSLSYYRNETHLWAPMDWADLTCQIENCRQMIFYPSVSADSPEWLYNEILGSYKNDVSSYDHINIVMTLTVPGNCTTDDLRKLWNLFGPGNYVKAQVLIADENHPYTAEIVLVKWAEESIR